MSPPHNRKIPASPAREENHDVAAAEHQAALRFDRLIDLIHHFIHGYGSLDLNPDQTFQLAEAVANAIMAIIKWIPIISQQRPSPETRLEALTALEEIGNIILWAGPTELGLKVRMHFDCNSVLEWAMLGIVDEMGPEEKLAILDEETHDDHPPLLFRIHQLKEEGRWCLLYDNMHWVINALEDTSLPDEDESYGAGN
jgi:hypothetical protein